MGAGGYPLLARKLEKELGLAGDVICCDYGPAPKFEKGLGKGYGRLLSRSYPGAERYLRGYAIQLQLVREKDMYPTCYDRFRGDTSRGQNPAYNHCESKVSKLFAFPQYLLSGVAECFCAYWRLWAAC
jgi:hypothetical protein